MAWYEGDPSVNLEVAKQLDAVTPATIGAASETDTFDTQAASYTLVAADAAKVVTIANASANTLTVPPNSGVAFPIGTEIPVIQLGAGQTTITAGGGVTVNKAAGTLKMLGANARVLLTKVAINTWVANGELAAT